MMRTAGLALLLLLCVLPVTARGRAPFIIKHGCEYTLVLPSAMRAALHSFDRHFTRWQQHDYLPSIVKKYRFTSRQAPFAIIGDFNGDGRTDLVVQGHNNQSDLTVCAMAHGSGYRVLLMQAAALTDPKNEGYSVGENKVGHGLWVYLTLVTPRTIKSDFEPRPLRLTIDAIEEVAWGKASDIYYYRRGSFHRYQTGD